MYVCMYVCIYNIIYNIIIYIIYLYVRVASRNRTLARFGDFDFSPSAASNIPSAPFYKVSELYALA